MKWVLLLCLVILAGCGRPATGPLNAPSNLRAEGRAGEIVLTWTDNSTAEEGFRIFRKLESNAVFPDVEHDTVSADVTTYTDTKEISSAESYVYQVQAFSAEGTGDPSSPSAAVKTTLGADKATLTVLRKADGAQGIITSSPTGINCVNRTGQSPGVCSFDFDKGKVVTLTATPDAGSQFTGWTGDCTGQSCVVTLDASKTVIATFVPIANKLVVTKTGDGTGLVTSDTTDAFSIDCGAKCEATSQVETRYGLRAVPASGSVFAGWTNCDSITSSGRCSITIGNGKGAEIIASFLNDVGAPTIDTFAATPNPLSPTATTVTLNWTVDDKGSSEPTTLELSDNSGSVTSPSLTGAGLEDSVEVSIPVSVTSVTFTLTAKNFFSGAAGVTRTVTVTRGSLPTITGFKASASSITSGQSVTLSWDALPAGTTLQLEKDPVTGDTVTEPATGTSEVETPTVDTTYTLIATNTFGTTRSNAVPVTVNPAPIAPTITSFTSAPNPGGGFVLSWELGGGAPTTLTISPTVGSVLNDPDNQVVVNPSATTTYTLSASNSANATTPVTAQTTVTIAPPAIPVITSFTAPGSPEDLTYATGTVIGLSWAITGQATLTGLTLTENGTAISIPNPTTATSTTRTLNAATMTYSLTATNAGGPSTPATKVITTGAKPEVGEVAVTAGTTAGTYNLTWTPTGTGPITYTLTRPDTPDPNDTITLVPTPSGTAGAVTAAFTPAGPASASYILTASNDFGDAPNVPGTGTDEIRPDEFPAPPAPPIISFQPLGSPEDLTYAVSTPLTLNWTMQNGPMTSLTLNSTVLSVTATSAAITLPNTATTTEYRLTARNANPTPGTATKVITTGAKPVISNVLVSTPGIGSTDYSVSWDISGDGTISYKLLDPGGAEVAGITFVGNTFLFTPAGPGDYLLRGSNEFGDAPNAPGIGEATVPIS